MALFDEDSNTFSAHVWEICCMLFACRVCTERFVRKYRPRSRATLIGSMIQKMHVLLIDALHKITTRWFWRQSLSFKTTCQSLGQKDSNLLIFHNSEFMHRMKNLIGQATSSYVRKIPRFRFFESFAWMWKITMCQSRQQFQCRSLLDCATLHHDKDLVKSGYLAPCATGLECG